jgi:single-strand DNA-binding protein
LPSGTIRWNLEVSCTDPDGRSVGVPVSWEGAVAESWDVDTQVVVTGSVRRRFFRSGGTTQSRTEVVASGVVEITRRRPEPAALARAVRVLGTDSLGALRSIVSPPAA